MLSEIWGVDQIQNISQKIGRPRDILRVVLLLRNIRHLIRPAGSPLSDPYPDDQLIPLALMYENMRVIQVFDPCFAAIHVHAAVGPEPLPHHPAPCARPHSRDTLGAADLLRSRRTSSTLRPSQRPRVLGGAAALVEVEQPHHPYRPASSSFGLSCTSAAAKRVFSHVKAKYGPLGMTQLLLADELQGSVILSYNKRQVG